MTDSHRRPTPVDPWPGLTDEDLPSPTGRSLPPELGPGAVAVLEGVSFMYSDAHRRRARRLDRRSGARRHATAVAGGFSPSTAPGCCRCGRAARSTSPRSSSSPMPETPGLPANQVGVRRLRSVGSQLRERIEVWSFAREPQRIELRLAVGTDFADLFEIKDVVRDRLITRTLPGRRRGARVRVPQRRVRRPDPGRGIAAGGPDRRRRVRLGAQAGRRPDLVGRGHRAARSRARRGGAAAQRLRRGRGRGGQADDATARWFAQVPKLQSDSDLLLPHRRPDDARPAGAAGGDAHRGSRR